MSVADHGFGITGEEQEHLGERFFRGRRASTVTGSGLGVWIAQAFVNANAGAIEVDSPGADRSAVVSILLPIAKTANLKTSDNVHA